MSSHRASIRWSRPATDAGFAYESFSRAHEWTFATATVPASSAPQYGGDASRVNPEEALVAALSSCHMLTFLAICARKGIVVDRYEDDPEGVLEKNEEGRLAVTRTTLRPKVTFAEGVGVDAESLRKLHESAHRGCFIAASVKTVVTVET